MPVQKANHQSFHPENTFEIEGVGYRYTSVLKPELAHCGSGAKVWTRTAESDHGRKLRLEWYREPLDERADDQICLDDCEMIVLTP